MPGIFKTMADPASTEPELTIVTLHFHPEPTGSAPQLAMFAAWAAQKGVKVKVVTARPHYPGRRVFDGYADGSRDHEAWRGVEIIRLTSPIRSGDGLLARLVTEGGFALALAWHMRRDHETGGTRLSLCPSVFVPLIAGLGRRGRHTALVHDIPSGLARPLGAGAWMAAVLRRLERWSLRACDEVVVLSPAMKRALKVRGVHRPMRVIPPMIDTDALMPQAEPAGPMTLLYSGAFGHKQGLDQLLDMAARLQRADPSIRLVLRGEGGREQAIRQQVKARGLANTHVRPLTGQETLNAALAQGHIHLLPQRPEGADAALPSKLFASMAVGRPVIATADPGTPVADWIGRAGCGLIARPYDAPALTDAVLRLAGDPEKRAAMGRAGRRMAEKSVSLDRVGRDLLAATGLSLPVGSL